MNDLDYCTCRNAPREFDGSEPGACEYCERLAHEERCGVTALRQAEGASEVSDEMQRDAWSEFEDDYLTDGNDGWLPAKVVSACRKAFYTAWPKGRSEAFAAALACIPNPQAEAAPGVVEAAIKGPLRFVDEGHPLGLVCYDRDGKAVSLHPAIMGAVFQALARQHGAREHE